MVEVFDSFDTSIAISELSLERLTSVLSASGQILIDNRGNPESYPVFEITALANTDLSGEWLVNSTGNNKQSLSFISPLTLNVDDVLFLDFENQKYTLNGETVLPNIKFPSNAIIKLHENSFNTFEINLSGEIKVSINYQTYASQERILHYVESFKFSEEIDYTTRKPFNSDKSIESAKTSSSYSFSLEKMSVDWYLWDLIKEGKNLRIEYHEYNPDTHVEKVSYLIGVTFDKWERGFGSIGNFIMTNVSGKALELIT